MLTRLGRTRLSNPFRHQLPSFSPFPLSAAWRLLRASSDGNSAQVSGLEQLRLILEDTYGAEVTVLLNSGTQALSLGLMLSGAGREGLAPIALPAYSCFDLASAAIWANRPIVFYDLDPETLSPDPDSLLSVCGEERPVVVVAPLFGVPPDWDLLTSLKASRGATILEDAAQGFGGCWKGQALGSLGSLSILSFGRGKGWTGTGQGGALLLRDDDLIDLYNTSAEFRFTDGADRKSNWRRQAIRCVALAGLARPEFYRIPRSMPFLGLGETHYREPSRPQPMARATAALIGANYPASAAAAAERQRNASEYRAVLRDDSHVAVVPQATTPSAALSGFLRFPVLLPGGMRGFKDPKRARRLGAEAVYPKILPDLPQVRRLMDQDHRSDSWPGARRLARDLVTLPTHPLTTREERDELTALIP